MRSAFLDWTLPWPGQLGGRLPEEEAALSLSAEDDFAVEVEDSSHALGGPAKYP